MTRPKLQILPATSVPDPKMEDMGRVERRRWATKTRLFDANGTEFVGLESVSTRPAFDSDAATLVNIQLRALPFDVVVLDEPPVSLEARLRALAAKWTQNHGGYTSDPADMAIETAQEECAEELLDLLDEVKA